MGKSRTIMITGGTGKIGLQFVKYFLAKGFTVVFISRTQKNVESLYERLDSYRNNNRLYGILVDLEEKNAPKQILDFLRAKKIFLDSLINNARNVDYLKINSNAISDRAMWMGELLIDVVVPYELSMAMAYQRGSKLKNIVNISSMYGVVPSNPNLYENPKVESPIQYSVAKAALIHLTKELAIRLVDKGIKVNSISYGGVKGRTNENFKKRYANLCPLGRMLKEEEVVGAVDFLVSDMSTAILGHNLVVDGGWSVW